MMPCTHGDLAAFRHGHTHLVLLLCKHLIDEDDDESNDNTDKLRKQEEQTQDKWCDLTRDRRDMPRWNTELLAAIMEMRHRLLQL